MARALRTGWILAVAGAVALVAACSLNPQPIPPGITDGESGGDAGANDKNPGAGGGLDGSDSSFSGDAGVTAPLTDASTGDAAIVDAGDDDAADAGDL